MTERKTHAWLQIIVYIYFFFNGSFEIGHLKQSWNSLKKFYSQSNKFTKLLQYVPRDIRTPFFLTYWHKEAREEFTTTWHYCSALTEVKVLLKDTHHWRYIPHLRALECNQFYGCPNRRINHITHFTTPHVINDFAWSQWISSSTLSTAVPPPTRADFGEARTRQQRGCRSSNWR